VRKEEILKVCDKAEIKAANDIDITDELGILINQVSVNYTEDEAERDKKIEYDHVRKLVQEELSPFYLKRQEQAVRAVRLSYGKFKDAYFACAKEWTEEKRANFV
jgi:hypothetical protein